MSSIDFVVTTGELSIPGSESLDERPDALHATAPSQAESEVVYATRVTNPRNAILSGIPEGLTPESIIMLLQQRMGDLNDQISGVMNEIKDRDGAARALTAQLDQLLSIQESLGNRDQCGGNDAVPGATNIEAVAEDLRAHGVDLPASAVDPDHGNVYPKGTIEAAIKSVEAQIRDVNSGNEMAMIKLQSLMQQRTSEVQLATNMLKALHEASQSVIGNIR